MHKLILAAALSLVTSATVAQLSPPGQLPKTITITNKATGDKIGTATISGNRAVLRDGKNELIGTLVVERDGTRTFYDPHGKIIPEGDLALAFKPE